ncbi:uncharacterized protein BJ171DRAFT_598644 [Polychytrium aggregatum]|uniref:uncharacterized protein n=1 Tax=Polychytrium aggregatum TaxID=110093 RepID=UPI0022FF0771|nr:uncharacterized protein BJ171DRAFT_598644 [Polychytrium aggregatum]KAI9205058.1 hypothetical protein BJ171DRAFT_598644 [Polychytrium aggregatum]
MKPGLIPESASRSASLQTKNMNAGTWTDGHTVFWGDFQCQGCFEIPLKGVRFRCLECPDFNLCAECMPMSSQYHSRHPNHKFFQWETPHIWSNVHCDCCMRPIVNERWRDQYEPRINLCAGCFIERDVHGYNGYFELVGYNQAWGNVGCDRCGIEPITGGRWRCQRCDSFNLCHDCYKFHLDTDKAFHGDDHPFDLCSPHVAGAPREVSTSNFHSTEPPAGTKVVAPPRAINGLSTDEIESALACSVCLELPVQAQTISCGHMFCYICLYNLWKSTPSKRCPCCRDQQHNNRPPNRAIAVDQLIELLMAKCPDAAAKDEYKNRKTEAEQHFRQQGWRQLFTT